MSVYLFRGRQLPGMVDTADMQWQSLVRINGGIDPLPLSEHPLLECQASPCLDLDEHHKLCTPSPAHP